MAEHGEALSLYLQLEDGKTADLEVVARAAIAFAASVREVAHAIDPELDVRVELSSGTPGSLSLNTIIRALKQVRKEHSKLTAVILATSIWFGEHAAEYTYEKVLDYVADQKHEHLDPAVKAEIESAVSSAVQGQAGKRQAQDVYSHLVRDPAVTGVGISRVPAHRPSTIVPRAEFQHRAAATEAAAEPRRQELAERARITLIQPVLDETTNRKWRFRFQNGGEFTATVIDKGFVRGILNGDVQVPLRSGIELAVDLVRRQVKVGDAWQDTSLRIEKVHTVYAPAAKPHASLAETLEDDPSNPH